MYETLSEAKTAMREVIRICKGYEHVEARWFIFEWTDTRKGNTWFEFRPQRYKDEPFSLENWIVPANPTLRGRMMYVNRV